MAEATIHASNLAFNTVRQDAGFREAVWLITQLAVAGGTKKPAEHMKSVGIDIADAESVVEVAMALAGEMERRIEATRQRSDFGEIAQRALISAVTDHLQEKMSPLLLTTADDVSGAIVKLGKQKDFAQLSRNFFSKLTNESLEYFLSKTLGNQVGDRRQFTTTGQLAKFEEALAMHCDEAAAIVEEFSGEWFSKNRFEGGGNISREAAEGFGWYAMEKMRRELAVRARD